MSEFLGVPNEVWVGALSAAAVVLSALASRSSRKVEKEQKANAPKIDGTYKAVNSGRMERIEADVHAIREALKATETRTAERLEKTNERLDEVLLNLATRQQS